MSDNRRSTDETITKMAGDIGYIRSRVDDLVETKKNHETRIGAIEGAGLVRLGRERLVNGAISIVFSTAVVLLGAWIGSK